MRLSESLRRNIFDSFVGGIINRFKIKSRRNVLVFEEILAGYIKKCEDAGHKKDMEDIGSYWGGLTIHEFLPHALRGVPVPIVANTIGMAVWRNIGLLDYMNVTQDKDIATLETRNEYITRIMGPNAFLIGAYGSILGTLTGKDVELTDAEQGTERCRYTFRIKNDCRAPVAAKDKKTYDKLNSKFFDEGHTLKDGLKAKIFRIKDNKIIFRERTVISLENSLFSIIGNRSVMIGEITGISRDFFKKIIRTENIEEGLKFLKKLMQIMGWGKFRIIIKSPDEVCFEIENKPYGLQKEPDNWDFLALMLLGYMQVFNKNFSIQKLSHGASLKIEFASAKP